VARQSEDALSRAERINALLARWKDELAGASQAGPESWWTFSPRTPTARSGASRDSSRVAFTTAQRGDERLGAAGILKQVNQAKRRPRVLPRRALLKILEEPARLVPMEAA